MFYQNHHKMKDHLAKLRQRTINEIQIQENINHSHHPLDREALAARRQLLVLHTRLTLLDEIIEFNGLKYSLG